MEGVEAESITSAIDLYGRFIRELLVFNIHTPPHLVEAAGKSADSDNPSQKFTRSCTALKRIVAHRIDAGIRKELAQGGNLVF